ncbi:type 1 glutamine amidotransferase domain-containing protein [Salinispira pacifica]|uniref:ThiJ/PfpI family protein n=1 Tax=Salinispira pacifica TaxID=1307761 RepID=V5WGG4_9SPIO|nr:type 1 glutamine amidotransferase domain-containing protein [Salinispira pacifica]AHC14927.1 ThiJ/PfpI family protein [Salinispira pacifica]
MKLQGKTIGMLVGPGFEELEFWAVYMRIKEEGADIKVMGLSKNETYEGKHGGMTATSQYGPGDFAADDLDALLVPGGWAPDKLRRVEEYRQLIREMDARGKVLGFICHAGWCAASAGIMKGRKAAGSEGIKDDMEHAGAVWQDTPALIDGNIVWGRVVEDIPEYNRLLVQKLSS